MASGKWGSRFENMRLDDHMQFSLTYIAYIFLAYSLLILIPASSHFPLPSLLPLSHLLYLLFSGVLKVSDPAITWPPLYLILSISYMVKKRNSSSEDPIS